MKEALHFRTPLTILWDTSENVHVENSAVDPLLAEPNYWNMFHERSAVVDGLGSGPHRKIERPFTGKISVFTLKKYVCLNMFSDIFFVRSLRAYVDVFGIAQVKYVHIIATILRKWTCFNKWLGRID